MTTSPFTFPCSFVAARWDEPLAAVCPIFPDQPIRLGLRCTMFCNRELHRWLADPVGYRVAGAQQGEGKGGISPSMVSRR